MYFLIHIFNSFSFSSLLLIHRSEPILYVIHIQLFKTWRIPGSIPKVQSVVDVCFLSRILLATSVCDIKLQMFSAGQLTATRKTAPMPSHALPLVGGWKPLSILQQK